MQSPTNARNALQPILPSLSAKAPQGVSMPLKPGKKIARNGIGRTVISLAVILSCLMTGAGPAHADGPLSTLLAPGSEGLSTMFGGVLPGGSLEAFSLILLSELGDKTFFVAGLFAMKSNAFISFVGSLGALAVMTVIAVGIGQIFHNIPDVGILKVGAGRNISSEK